MCSRDVFCFVFLVFIFCLAEAGGRWEATAAHSERLRWSLCNLEHVCCKTHSDADRLLREPVRNDSSDPFASVRVSVWCERELDSLFKQSNVQLEAGSLLMTAGSSAPHAWRGWAFSHQKAVKLLQVCLVPCQVWDMHARPYNCTSICSALQDQSVLVCLKLVGSFSVAVNALVANFLSQRGERVFAVRISNVIDSSPCHLLLRLDVLSWTLVHPASDHGGGGFLHHCCLCFF